MKINWKLRLQNKTTLVTLATLVITFVYQILGVFGIVPAIGQDTVTQLFMILVNILSAVGVVVDPTTAPDMLGLSDSAQAMGYESPKEN